MNSPTATLASGKHRCWTVVTVTPFRVEMNPKRLKVHIPYRDSENKVIGPPTFKGHGVLKVMPHHHLQPTQAGEALQFQIVNSHRSL